jgi:preprotein translocase subunit YajC
MNLIIVFVGSYFLLIGVLALMLVYYFKTIRPRDEKELQEWLVSMNDSKGE